MDRFYKLAILIFWLVLGYCVVQFYNPLRVTSKMYNVNKTFYFLPQGWGFFTKSPKEELVDIYKFENGKLVKVNFSNASSQNYFGLSKKARLLFVEMGNIIGKLNISKKSWKRFKGNNISSIKNLPVVDTIEINSEDIFFKRNTEYYLIKYKTIPFAWSEMHQENYRPYEAIKIYTK